LYASAGGTAQLFAMHLVEKLQQQQKDDGSLTMTMVSLESLADYPTLESMLLMKSNRHDKSSTLSTLSPPPLYIFLLPTAGVGEPPGMAKQWYESLMSSQDIAATAATTTTTTTMNDDDGQPPSLEYAIFGLGNSLGTSYLASS
jgi:sulfite reductase alpha subunit-like flavoprotein